jgi:hypothetical protein
LVQFGHNAVSCFGDPASRAIFILAPQDGQSRTVAIGVNDVVNATTVGACWMTKRCRQTSPKIRQSPAEE